MDYQFENDAVYVFTSCPEIGDQFAKRQLVMTKEIFIACYEKWVKNAEKTGTWKKIDYADEVNGYFIPNYECSNCQNWARDITDYCPSCGARMVNGNEE